jgi:hypothetical protein
MMRRFVTAVWVGVRTIAIVLVGLLMMLWTLGIAFGFIGQVFEEIGH